MQRSVDVKLPAHDVGYGAGPLVARVCPMCKNHPVGSLQTSNELYRGKDLLPAKPQWSNYVTAWKDGDLGTYLPNSVIYTVSAVLGILVVSLDPGSIGSSSAISLRTGSPDGCPWRMMLRARTRSVFQRRSNARDAGMARWCARPPLVASSR